MACAISPEEWISYYTKRIVACLNDPDVSDAEFRQWMGATIGDLEDVLDHNFSIQTKEEVDSLAQALHQFIFHNGPEPE